MSRIETTSTEHLADSFLSDFVRNDGYERLMQIAHEEVREYLGLRRLQKEAKRAGVEDVFNTRAEDDMRRLGNKYPGLRRFADENIGGTEATMQRRTNDPREPATVDGMDEYDITNGHEPRPEIETKDEQNDRGKHKPIIHYISDVVRNHDRLSRSRIVELVVQAAEEDGEELSEKQVKNNVMNAYTSGYIESDDPREDDELGPREQKVYVPGEESP